MTQTEALRLALGALIEVRDTNIHGLTLTQDYHDAITAIKAALANEALERKAENARELGLDYEPLEAKDEPVGYFSVNDYGNWEENESNNGTPLYITPPAPQQEAKDEPVEWKMGASGIGGTGVIVQPQRTWVGLTDEEKKSFWTADQMSQQEWDELFSAIEAKLRSNNENTRG